MREKEFGMNGNIFYGENRQQNVENAMYMLCVVFVKSNTVPRLLWAVRPTWSDVGSLHVSGTQSDG